MVLSLGACFPDNGIPEPDTCDVPETEPVDSVEIGNATLSSVFEPWQDGDTVALVFGSQGGAMLPVRIRVRGVQGTCLRHELTVENDAGEVVIALDYPVQLYEQDDGSMVSDTNYAIFDFPPDNGATVTVTLVVGSVTVSRSIQVSRG